MPKFHTEIVNNQPIITVCVTDPQIEVKSLNELQRNSFPALIDIGASSSVISHNVVEKLNLKPCGQTSAFSVSHEVVVNTYNASIGIPVSELDENNNPICHHVKHFNLLVSEMPVLHNRFDVLIGMDIIQSCILIIHNNLCIFSY